MTETTGRAPALARSFDVLDLEPIELGLFRSRRTGQPGHRLFGGEVCAQALVAAERTTTPEASPHSVHAYFLRPGDAAERVVFRVDELHEGSTFRRRRVTALQHGEPLLCLEASFTTERFGTDKHVPPPEAPAPEECPPLERGSPGGWPVGLEDVFDIRPVTALGLADSPVAGMWFRPRGDDTGGVSPAAVLTYFSDFGIVGARERRPRRTEVDHATSLDHALWMHNEPRLDQWLYYAEDSLAAGPYRKLSAGRIVDRDGRLIATVMREARTPAEHTPSAPHS